MEQETIDQIMDIDVKGSLQHKIQLYRVVKARQLLHQGKWLTKIQVQQKFPHLMGALNAMETIASWGGRIDPDGYRWPPTYSTNSKGFFILVIFL